MLSGHLQITLGTRIGQGSFGDVFIAQGRGDGGFERTFAIKCLRPEMGEEPDIVRGFEEEARICGNLSHPHVVQVQGFTQTSAGYILIMEYLDGVTLSQLMSAWSRTRLGLPFTVCLDLVEQLCQGLQFAHTACDRDGRPLGLVHRDIKPSNLMVTTAGHLKIMDFGIARSHIQAAHTSGSTFKGTLGYVAPEQALGAPDLGPAADQFAAAVILAELIQGRVVFPHRIGVGALLAAQRPDPADSVARCEEALPGVGAVLTRALALRPQDRYPDMAAFGRAIRSLRRQIPDDDGEIAALVRGLKRGDGPLLLGARPLVAQEQLALPELEISLIASGVDAGSSTQVDFTEGATTLVVDLTAHSSQGQAVSSVPPTILPAAARLVPGTRVVDANLGEPLDRAKPSARARGRASPPLPGLERGPNLADAPDPVGPAPAAPPSVVASMGSDAHAVPAPASRAPAEEAATPPIGSSAAGERDAPPHARPRGTRSAWALPALGAVVILGGLAAWAWSGQTAAPQGPTAVPPPVSRARDMTASGSADPGERGLPPTPAPTPAPRTAPPPTPVRPRPPTLSVREPSGHATGTGPRELSAGSARARQAPSGAAPKAPVAAVAGGAQSTEKGSELPVGGKVQLRVLGADGDPVLWTYGGVTRAATRVAEVDVGARIMVTVEIGQDHQEVCVQTQRSPGLQVCKVSKDLLLSSEECRCTP